MPLINRRKKDVNISERQCILPFINDNCSLFLSGIKMACLQITFLEKYFSKRFVHCQEKTVNTTGTYTRLEVLEEFPLLLCDFSFQDVSDHCCPELPIIHSSVYHILHGLFMPLNILTLSLGFYI